MLRAGGKTMMSPNHRIQERRLLANAIYPDPIQTSLLIDANFLVLTVLTEYRPSPSRARLAVRGG
jgi:hypothetical protein